MIEKINMSFSPCPKDQRRYKINIKGNQEDLTRMIRRIGNVCGRPFVPLSKVYNWAFYVYGIDDDLKKDIEKIMKEFEAEAGINGKVEEKDPQEVTGEEDKKSLEEKMASLLDSLEKPQGVSVKEISIEEKGKEKAPPPHEGEPPKVEVPEAPPEGEPSKGEGAPSLIGDKDFWTLKLLPEYTFENFVVGPNNRFTHAASQAVAENPGRIYNPLFIYGGVGLGKTHLMHAIGHYVLEKNKNAKVLYVTTEKFISEVIEAIRRGNIQAFRNQYHQLDLLLVDDIQFLTQAESTQEEFFHIFNILHDTQKQIVITSDKPPKQLVTLEDRLKSRFEWGLIADIKSPNLETRIAILKRKEQDQDLQLDDEILLYVAGKLKSNVRELEGFVKRIHAYAKLTKQKIEMNLVKQLMEDLLPKEGREVKEGVEAPAEEVAEPKTMEEAPPPKEEPPEEFKQPPILREVTVREEGPEQAPPPQEEKGKPPHMEPAPPLKEEAPPKEEKPMPPSVKGGRIGIGKKTQGAKAIEVACFYPQGCEGDYEIMKKQFEEALGKHKLKFFLDVVFEKEYMLEKRVNYGMFAELCKTNKVKIAIVLGPPSESPISHDVFVQMLGALLEDEGIGFQLVPSGEVRKQYKYLNLLLDIALAG